MRVPTRVIRINPRDSGHRLAYQTSRDTTSRRRYKRENRGQTKIPARATGTKPAVRTGPGPAIGAKAREKARLGGNAGNLMRERLREVVDNKQVPKRSWRGQPACWGLIGNLHKIQGYRDQAALEKAVARLENGGKRKAYRFFYDPSTPKEIPPQGPTTRTTESTRRLMHARAAEKAKKHRPHREPRTGGARGLAPPATRSARGSKRSSISHRERTGLKGGRTGLRATKDVLAETARPAMAQG